MSVPLTLCRMPWTHVQIEQDGSFRPCCRTLGFRKNRQFDQESYEKSDELRSLKQALLSGEKPTSCDRCWNDERHGAYSFRQIENKKYPNFLPETKSQLKTIEVRLGNICNLSCRMCSTLYSSKWIAEVRSATTEQVSTDGFLKATGTISQTYQFDQDSLTHFAELAAECDEVHISGGEPFHSPFFEHFISSLKEKSKARQALSISTNGTQYKASVMKILKDFRRVDISISVDGIHLVNDYIRTGSRWGEIEKNLNSFKRDADQIGFSLAPTINIYSVFYLPELLTYFEERLSPQFALKQKFNFQISPTWQSLSAIPQFIKEKILEKYIKFGEGATSRETSEFLNSVARRLEQTDFNASHLHDFKRLNPVFDQLKNQSFEYCLPEFAHLLMEQ